MDKGSVPYVLLKNGMFYAHNSCGYVSSVLLAELYTEEDAKKEVKGCEEVMAIPVTDLVAGPDKVQEYIDRLEAMRDTFTA